MITRSKGLQAMEELRAREREREREGEEHCASVEWKKSSFHLLIFIFMKTQDSRAVIKSRTKGERVASNSYFIYF